MKTLKELIQQEQEKHNQNKFTALSELIAEVATTTAKAVGELIPRGQAIGTADYEEGFTICRTAFTRALKTFLGEEGV